jgi:hypothetical protein
MDAFEAYKVYCALKSHFNSKTYDYFKYNGRVRASKSTFDKRSDKYFFHKLSKHKDMIEYLVANFVYKGDAWVGDLVRDAESDKAYLKYTKTRDSLTYIFTEDIKKLEDDFNSNFEVKDGQHPTLLRKYLRDEISIETLVILNDFVGFTKMWNKKIDDTIIWPTVCLKMKKFKPFFKYNEVVMKKVVKERFKASA